jgi:hypothetical protein
LKVALSFGPPKYLGRGGEIVWVDYIGCGVSTYCKSLKCNYSLMVEAVNTRKSPMDLVLIDFAHKVKIVVGKDNSSGNGELAS